MADRSKQTENRGKPLTTRQRQLIVNEIRTAPNEQDNVIAGRVAPKIGRRVDRSTVARLRKRTGLPSSTEATAQLPTPLAPRDRDLLRKLLSRIFMPGLHECHWSTEEPVNGMVVRMLRRGEFRCFRREGHIVRLWFTPGEEERFFYLVTGHLGRDDGNKATNRYRRLAAVVARQLDLTETYDLDYRDSTESHSLIQLWGLLDGGLNPGLQMKRSRAFKLVFRHARLTAGVDEFVARVQSQFNL